jgi:ubiquitin-like protein ATG12
MSTNNSSQNVEIPPAVDEPDTQDEKGQDGRSSTSTGSRPNAKEAANSIMTVNKDKEDADTEPPNGATIKDDPSIPTRDVEAEQVASETDLDLTTTCTAPLTTTPVNAQPQAPAAAAAVTPKGVPKIPTSPAVVKPAKAGASVVAASAKANDATADPPQRKVKVHFVAIGSAPILKKTKFKIDAHQTFAYLAANLRRTLKLADTKEELFMYLHSSFCPSPDDTLGNLEDCFKVRDELIVQYCLKEAWG